MDGISELLLVEDEAAIAALQIRILKKNGINALSAFDGESAVKLFASKPRIDFVLMDINLGDGIDGTEAAKRMLAIREVPVVFLSSHTEAEVVNKTETISSYGYVVKSAGETVLMASIKMALRLFQTRGELATQKYEVERANTVLERQTDELRRQATELEQRQSSLLAQEELVRTTFYSIGDGVISTDRLGIVQRMNTVAEQLCGWSESEALGRQLEEVFHIAKEDDETPVENPVRRVLREGRIVGLANHTILISRDGTRRPIADSGAPIRGDSSSIDGVVLVFRDQTQERAAQKVLEENERELRGMFEVATVGLVQAETSKGKIIRCNKRFTELVGYSVDELKTMTFSSLTHPEDREADWEIFRKARDRVIPEYRRVKRYVRKDGGVAWARVNVAFIRDDTGNPLRTFTVVEDIGAERAAEAALKESELRYRTVANYTQDWEYWVNMDGTYVYISPSVERITGYRADEFENNGDLMGSLVHADDRLTFDGHVADVLAGRAENDHRELDFRITRKDGTVRWISHVCRTVLDDEGRSLGVRASNRDITDRVLAQTAREEGLALYRRTLDRLMEGCQIIDRDWRYIYVNDAVLLHGKKQRSELIGQTMMAAYPGIEKSEMFAGLKRAMEDRIPSRIESEFVFEDGSRGFFELSVEPVDLGILIFSIDISERKRAEASENVRSSQLQEMQATEFLLSSLIDSSSQAVAVGFEDGRLVKANPAFFRLVGYDPEDLFKIDWFKSLTPPEWVDATLNTQKLLRETGKSVRYEKEYIRKDGTRVPVSLLTQLMKSSDGKLTYLYAFVDDLSERKRSESDLQNALREKQMLLQELQHRVKNSLAMMDAIVQLEGMEEANIPSRSVLKTIHARIQVLARLYALLDTEANSNVHLEVYFRALCESLAETYMNGDSGHRIEADLQDIELDLKRSTNLGLVLNELVMNSIKHGMEQSKPGTITVRLEKEVNSLKLVVLDDGPGLPADFDPKKTSGLGFQLIQDLVRQLNGTLERSEGKGTCISIVMPL